MYIYSNSWKDMRISGYVVITTLVARVEKDAVLKATTTGPRQFYLHCYVSLHKLKQVACSRI